MLKKPTFKISNRLIGYDHKPLVIPEMGINHGGSIEVAFKIIDAAKRAGAEIIKHQTHIPDDEMSSEAKFIKPGNSNKSIYDVISKNSLSEEEEYKLFNYTKKKKLIYLSTPFSRLAADRLKKFGVKVLKIGSGEFNNFPLISHIINFKKPIIISTGMHSLESVKKIVNFLNKKRAKFVLLHTTNLYPTPDHLVRLNSLVELQKTFPKQVIGLSDHTGTNYSSYGAVALGASIIEKHFTDHNNRKGPDISASIDEKNLKELIIGCNKIFLQRGGNKGHLSQEQVTRNFAFASVVAIRKIKKGEIFSKKNIWVKRPGTGHFKAKEFYKILGKKCKKNIEENIQLKKAHVYG